MSLSVSYMGTKRHLADSLTSLIASCSDGPFLDLFSGMCSVGRAVAPCRQVWSNDLQAFAQLVARSHFTLADLPQHHVKIAEAVSQKFRAHKAHLLSVYAAQCEEEQLSLASGDHLGLAQLFDRQVSAANGIVSPRGPVSSYDLFVSRYAGTFFSFEQAIDLDAVRAGLDHLLDQSAISDDGSCPSTWCKFGCGQRAAFSGGLWCNL